MAAPTNANLLDFESNYENALVTYLTAINGTPFAQTLTMRTLQSAEAILETPRAMVRCTSAGLATQQEGSRTTDSGKYFSHYAGQIELTVATQRNDVSQDQGKLRGWLRVAMLQPTAAFNANTTPYYQTLRCYESGSTQSYDSDNDEIVSSLTYNLEWYIKPDQWAAS